MNKKLFGIGFLVGIVITVGVAFFTFKHFMTQPDISLNSMKLEDLNGRKLNVGELMGKPLIVNYWATWCAPCLQEFPMIEKVKKQFDNKIDFVMVSDETAKVISNFKDKNLYTFTFLKSSVKLDNLNVRPVTYFYNKKGELISKKEGEIDEKQLIEQIEKIQ